MKNDQREASKALYEQLRRLTCARLWDDAVAQFDRATPEERIRTVSVVRAVGVVFAAFGSVQEKNDARLWLEQLLRDPAEKVRRYAMAAIPKIGPSPASEAVLLDLLRASTSEREKEFIAATLDKIGGTATLEAIASAPGRLQQTTQKIKASLARAQNPSTVRMDRTLSDFGELRIHLRGRNGLERIVRAEVEERTRETGKFRVVGLSKGLVAITPVSEFSLADVFQFRCFGTAGLVLGTVERANEAEFMAALASLIVSPLSSRIMTTFTEGSIRYRLDFVGRGHQRGAVRQIANQAYALCPEILNDARSACWTIGIYPTQRGHTVELCPRFSSDPRFQYRQDEVPAASQPPLAACLARLAGRMCDEVVWDPFCGSGLELIERCLLGGVRKAFGTDLSADAITCARNNFAAANLPSPPASLVCCDFRDFARVEGLGPNTATLILTNPPFGKRVPVNNLRRLMGDFIAVAATVLQPGGRLVFVNPLRMETPHRSLKLQSSEIVDVGGFNCRLQKFVKV